MKKSKPRSGDTSVVSMEAGAEACETLVNAYRAGNINISDAKMRLYQRTGKTLRKNAALAENRTGCQISFNQPEQAIMIARERQRISEQKKAEKEQQVQGDLLKFPPIQGQ
tara:strand:+ start:271 stop:603 length:333 start_codon:yes stop_codon:yes gene_type:complete